MIAAFCFVSVKYRSAGRPKVTNGKKRNVKLMGEKKTRVQPENNLPSTLTKNVDHGIILADKKAECIMKYQRDGFLSENAG